MKNTSPINKQKISFLYDEMKTDKLDTHAIKLGVNRTQLIAKSLDEYVSFLDNQFSQYNNQKSR